MSTSRTDTEAYRKACASAATDWRMLAPAFRFMPGYAGVLDVSEELGAQYRAALLYDPQTDDPVLLRYHWQRQEIRRRFGRKHEVFPFAHGFRIVEIGGGFGGLAALVAPHVGCYEIVDLPEVRLLQDAHLLRFGIRLAKVTGEIGLLISCYAFSELTPEVQREYAATYIARAKHGYLICNFLGGSLPFTELLRLMPAGARSEPEVPNSHPDNCVITW